MKVKIRKESFWKGFWKYFVLPMLFILLFFLVLANWDNLTSLGTPSGNCNLGGVPTNVCYKTVCNFWGCGHVQVDLTSAQCEVKATVCG